MALLDQIQQQRQATILRYVEERQRRLDIRDNRASQQGVIESVEGVHAWVRIRSDHGGGRVHVRIETGRAYGVGQSITVTGDRGYF